MQWWREGDPAGRRSFADIGDLRLEKGRVLPSVRMAYETAGALSPTRDNAVLVLHALTGDSHVAGPAGPGHPTPGWWDGMIGPGAGLDTDHWFVVTPNVLGGCQGTTGPSSRAPDGRAWGGRFPRITVRDQVAAEAALADALGIDRWALVLGGSMGGMRVLEWAVGYPDRVARAVPLATTAAAGADQIAWCAAQLAAIRADPHWNGGDYYDQPEDRRPTAGLGVARRIAHVTYRSAQELEDRFGRRHQPGEDPGAGGRYAVESYLDHQAGKLVGRFDAGSYVVLTEAMNSHDVGRDRGGAAAALARIRAEVTVVAVDSDRLYPVSQSDAIARHVPGARGPVVVPSVAGHDGFLTETEAVGAVVSDVLADRAVRAA
jgi:homoserine O-acetyltransferase